MSLCTTVYSSAPSKDINKDINLREQPSLRHLSDRGKAGAVNGVSVSQGFGDQFIHTGTSSSALPQYVDPYELLNEPTVDPYFPINN